MADCPLESVDEVLLPCWNIAIDESPSRSSGVSTSAAPGNDNNHHDDDDNQYNNNNNNHHHHHHHSDNDHAPVASSSPPLRPEDVICGRDATAQRHHGNLIYRKLIRAYRPYYHQARRRIEKRQIIRDIVDRIHENGGRFMVQDDNNNNNNGDVETTTKGGVWKPQEESKVYDKVSHSLRSSHHHSSFLLGASGTTSTTTMDGGGRVGPPPRRTRRYCVIPPTEAENRLFQHVLTSQQAMFQALVAQQTSSYSPSPPSSLYPSRSFSDCDAEPKEKVEEDLYE